jgi:hypothetical protein
MGAGAVLRSSAHPVETDASAGIKTGRTAAILNRANTCQIRTPFTRFKPYSQRKTSILPARPLT